MRWPYDQRVRLRSRGDEKRRQPSGGNDETLLVQRLQGGDEQAFVILFQRYQSEMVNLAMAFVPSRAVAEEVVQDAWLGVVKGIDRFAGRSSLRTWLFHIVVNRARTAGAREHKQGGEHALTGPLESPERFTASGAWAVPPVHWSEEVEDRLAAQALTSVVHRAIAGLLPAQRQVVVLRDVEGLSSEEVCALLGISAAHQRVLLHRGRVAVRRTIEAERAEAQL